MNDIPKPASPLPWRTHETDDGEFIITTDEGDYVAMVDNDFPQPAKDDAAYLVLAANAFPKLVEALWKLSNEAHGFLSMADPAAHGHTNMKVLKLRIEEAREALALVKGEKE